MSLLDELVAGAVEDQRSRENNVPLAEVKRMAFEASAPIDARQWLKKADGIPVIAEINESMTIDPDDVASKITPRTRAIPSARWATSTADASSSTARTSCTAPETIRAR